MGRQFIETLLDVVDGEIRRNTYGFGVNNKLILGGTNAPEGGSGIPWGGLVGTLIQSRIAYDTTEAAVISGCPSGWLASGSLLDNLNHIRHHQLPATWFEASPTYPPSMKVRIASGLWYYGDGDYLYYTGGVSPTITMPSGLPRIDLIYMDNSGTLYVKEGTEAADPTITMPTASGVLPLTAVYIHPSATAISWSGDYMLYSGYIHRDMRPIITYPPGAVSGGGGTTYTFGGWLHEDATHKVKWQPDCPAVLRAGVVTEYSNIDDALDAADTAYDVVLVPPGTWTSTKSHTLTSYTSIVGIGAPREDCIIQTTTNVGTRFIWSSIGCNIRDVTIKYISSSSSQLIALYGWSGNYITRVYGYCSNTGSGGAIGISGHYSTITRSYGQAYISEGDAYGIFDYGSSSFYRCIGRAQAAWLSADDVAGFRLAATSEARWCRGYGTAYGDRYGLIAGYGTSSTSHSYWEGDTADVRVESGATLNMYADQYDTTSIAGTLNHVSGDRPGKDEDATITGDWTFGKPLILDEQASDPSGVANKGKLYTKDDGAGNTELYYVDESGNVNKLTPPSGGGGAATFLELTDTPSSYVSYSGYYVGVKGTEDGLEFITCSGGGGGATTFVGLTDTPASYIGASGYVVAVKNGENGLEFLSKAPDADKLDGYDATAFPRKSENATIDGLWTFDRGANAPFAVDADSLKVTNLDADKLDGYDSGDFPRKAEGATITGAWTLDEEITLSEQASDPSNVANKGKLYTKDDGSGNTELYYLDESGNIDKLTPITEIGDTIFSGSDLLLLNPFSHVAKVGSNYYWLGTRNERAQISGGLHFEGGRWADTQALQIEEGVTNIVSNPSAETNTTGWGPGGGALSRTTDYARFGEYSLKDTTTAGTYNGLDYDETGVLTAATEYTFSIWVKGDSSVDMLFAMRNNADTGSIAQTIFTPTGEWQRVSVTGTTEAGQTNLHMMLRKNNDATIITFYADGFQVEENGYPTSYCDGDQGVGYAWSGTAHASSSQRTNCVCALDDLGHLVANNNTWSYRLVFQANYAHDDTWPRHTTGYNYLADMRNSGDTGKGVILRYDHLTYKFHVWVNGTWVLSTVAMSFDAGTWFDFVVTTDFSGYIRLYIDGIEVDSADISAQSSTAIDEWKLGSGRTGSSNRSGITVAEYAVFDRVLTANEVATIYRRNKPIVDPLNQLALSVPNIYYHDEQNDIIYIWTKTGIIALQTPSTVTHGAKVYRSTTHSIPNNSQTTMSFNTEVYDVGGLWAAGSPTRFTPSYAGYYMFGAAVGWYGNVNGVRIIGLMKNGGGAPGFMLADQGHNGMSQDDLLSVNTVVYLNGTTDYVEASLFQTSGGALNAGPGGANDYDGYCMWIHKLP